MPTRAEDARAPSRRPTGGDIIVTAPIAQSERDVLSGTSIVTGDQLERALRSSIGETLARQPGVSASSFGPSASRPILRGFQGERIRILTDGIGSIDVSNTSADHAVAIDPLLAERIEVLRGPAALLFGSSAVGGVVNVLDGRIPDRLPENGYRLDALASYGSAAEERSVAGSGNLAIGQNVVLHADGSYQKSDDLGIGGYVLSPSARSEALASGDPDIEDLAGLGGTLPKSASESWVVGVGAAWVDGDNSIGLAYSHYDNFYGVPIRYALEPGEEAEAPRLQIEQDRVDLRMQADLSGFIDTIRLRAAYADYTHAELEEDGGVGTRFFNKGLEGRLELVQFRRGIWQGASGVQYVHRDFDVIGEEAFLPRNSSSQIGLFTLQQFDWGALKAEGGLRYEHSSQRSTPEGGDLRFPRITRDYDAISGAAGLSYGFSEAVRVGFNLSHTERAPSPEELFANGPHGGTQAWELGSPDFGLEKSWGIEATLHVHRAGFSFDASAYYNWFSGYIAENQVDQSICEAAAAPSGRDVDLPCFQFTQRRARYYGVEADMIARLATVGPWSLNADLLGDYVHATIVDESPVARIPAPRILGGLEAQSDALTARGEVEHVFRQTRVAPFETTTAAYTQVNASVSWKPLADNDRVSLLLAANNIFDVDARRASSVLKDFAPLAGRDIRVTLRVGI